ncbi:V-type proton ATPase subunit H [Manis javanica]|nr:V-type proton ATPase subunit H [Manis javanica]
MQKKITCPQMCEHLRRYNIIAVLSDLLQESVKEKVTRSFLQHSVSEDGMAESKNKLFTLLIYEASQPLCGTCLNKMEIQQSFCIAVSSGIKRTKKLVALNRKASYLKNAILTLKLIERD